MQNDFLWVEKYRPRSFSDCIVTDNVRSTFQTFIEQGNVPNLLLSGGAGVGKTTIAKAVLHDLGCDVYVINGSLDRNIGTLRNEIQAYASTVSLTGGRKYVLLDEADYLNPESTQPALRAFMQDFSANCGFVLTCNYAHKIMEPLRSRCSIIDFRINNAEKLQLMSAYVKRCFMILKGENVEADRDSLTAFVVQNFPDLRKTINELQRYAAEQGKIDAGILAKKSVDNFKELIDILKKKEFNRVKQWVADNRDVDIPSFVRKFYDSVSANFPPQDIPRIVLILADYQYKSAFVADQEINTLAMLTEIMLAGD